MPGRAGRVTRGGWDNASRHPQRAGAWPRTRFWKDRGPMLLQRSNGGGRGPDAGRTVEFKETDADRTHAGPLLHGGRGAILFGMSYCKCSGPTGPAPGWQGGHEPIALLFFTFAFCTGDSGVACSFQRRTPQEWRRSPTASTPAAPHSCGVILWKEHATPQSSTNIDQEAPAASQMFMALQPRGGSQLVRSIYVPHVQRAPAAALRACNIDCNRWRLRAGRVALTCHLRATYVPLTCHWCSEYVPGAQRACSGYVPE
eukprot:gene9074-biopygen153